MKKPCHIIPKYLLFLDFCQALSKSKSQTLQFPYIKKFSQGFMKSQLQFLCVSTILSIKSFFILEMIRYFEKDVIEHNVFVTIFSLFKIILILMYAIYGWARNCSQLYIVLTSQWSVPQNRSNICKKATFGYQSRCYKSGSA